MSEEEKEKGLSETNERPFLMSNNDKKTEKNEIQKVKQSLTNDTFTQGLLKDSDKLANFCDKVVKANLCPHTKPEDAMLSIITGQELGLSIMASLNGIYCVNGRATLGVHLKKGILLANGIIFQKIRDCEPKFVFVKTDKDGKVIRDSKDIPIEIKRGFLDEQPENTKKSKEPYDYQTIYIFHRYIPVAGKYVKNTAYGKFSYSDANTAGLLDKDNWKNYLRDMLAARAFSRGSNEIADDLLGGMLSPSELSDIDPNMVVIIDNEGKEKIINNN